MRKIFLWPLQTFFWAALILLILGVVTVAAQESEPRPTLEAAGGFDGYYKRGYWLPVAITAANDGPAVEGSVRVITGADTLDNRVIYDALVSLPTQSNKRITLPVFPAQAFSTELPVELLTANGQIVSQAVTNRLLALDAADLLYGVVTSEPDEFTFLENVTGQRRDAAVAFLSLADLPETAVTWQALDILILDDADASQLSPAQINALQTWLENGGQLVVTGGPNWQKTAVPLAELLPVTISGTANANDLPTLRENIGVSFRDAGPYLVVESSLRQGELIFHEDGLPLLAKRPVGRGAVYFLSLDPKLAPLKDWDGSPIFWAAVAGQVPELPIWSGGIQNSSAAETAVSSLPSLSLPSMGALILFLVVYILLIGPVNYLLLKRFNRRELAWVTIPVLVLLFSGLTYFIGFQIKGNSPIINQMSVVTGQAGVENGRVQSVLGLYSPRRAAYNLNLPASSAARPLSDRFSGTGSNFEAITRGNALTVREIRTDISEIATFLVDSTQPLPAVNASAAIVMDGGDVVLDIVVENLSAIILENTSLLIGNQAYALGDLTPGERQTLRQVVSNPTTTALFSSRTGSAYPLSANVETLLGTSDYYNDVDVFPRWQMLQALEGSFSSPGNANSNTPSTVTLLAWSDAPQIDASLEESNFETQQTSLYLIDLPLQQQALQGENIHVPLVLLDWVVLRDSGLYDPSIQNMLLNGGWIEFEFTPGAQFNPFQVTDLAIALQSYDPSLPTPNVLLWDWEQENWREVDNVNWGETAVPEYGRFIGAANQIRLRLEDNSSYGVEIESVYPILTGNMP